MLPNVSTSNVENKDILCNTQTKNSGDDTNEDSTDTTIPSLTSKCVITKWDNQNAEIYKESFDLVNVGRVLDKLDVLKTGISH